MHRIPILLTALAWAAHAPRAQEPAPSGVVERGEYLVHHVAMCVQCHSPRDARGELLRNRRLHGGTIPVDSPYPGSQWGFEAPHLAGLPGLGEEAIVTLLTQGRRPGRPAPRPPMPPFRMTEEDARAVVAYLKSLGRR